MRRYRCDHPTVQSNEPGPYILGRGREHAQLDGSALHAGVQGTGLHHAGRRERQFQHAGAQGQGRICGLCRDPLDTGDRQGRPAADQPQEQYLGQGVRAEPRNAQRTGPVRVGET